MRIAFFEFTPGTLGRLGVVIEFTISGALMMEPIVLITISYIQLKEYHFAQVFEIYGLLQLELICAHPNGFSYADGFRY